MITDDRLGATFRAQLTLLAAAVRWGAADPDDIAATVARLRPGDADSWLREWTATGGAAWAEARARASAGRYLHAASCYAAALALIAATDGSVSRSALAVRQQECWLRAAWLLGGELVAAGVLFPAALARRPLVLFDTGSLAVSQAWSAGGAAAHTRGWHWLALDGASHVQAVDAMAARADVERVALVRLDPGALAGDEDRLMDCLADRLSG